jgi:hypothetical protein
MNHGVWNAEAVPDVHNSEVATKKHNHVAIQPIIASDDRVLVVVILLMLKNQNDSVL